ncbi:MAG: MBL fold metallo-hydrolase [Chitinophagaceae bacterium]
MKFTYWGHATFSVVVGGTKLLFDPFVTPNPLAKDIDIKTIGADYILISHGHGDHIATQLPSQNIPALPLSAPRKWRSG